MVGSGPPDLSDIDFNVSSIGIIAGLFVLLVFAAVLLPVLQRILYVMFIANPWFLQWGLVTLAVVGIGFYKDSKVIMIGGLAVGLILLFFVAPLASGIQAHTDMANQMQSNAEQVNTLPNTSDEHVRTLPRSIADNYASSSLQRPQYRLTDSDIAYVNGSYKWSYGVVPDNFFVAWFGQQTGTMYINMEQINKSTTQSDTDFVNGRGQLFFDSYAYKTTLNNPFVLHKYGTTFNSEHNGEEFIAHSTVKHNWKFKLFPIPQLYAVPAHGSVDVMNTKGDITVMSPKEAQQSEKLEGENFYPYSVAQFKVESMKYIHGALNKWFQKKDVLSVADLPEGGNSWPISVPTETGPNEPPELTYFTAAEAAGSGNGVYQIWMFDGQTGEASYQEFDENQIGPQKAIDFVERQSEVNRLSSADAVSPIPIVKGGQLFWHVKVVPQSESGIIYTAFVNADNGDVTLVEDTKPIYAFLSEKEFKEVGEGEDNTGEDGEASGDLVEVTVVVTDGNGNIKRTENITVPKGGETDINIVDPRNKTG